ncbi:MAG: HAMP domain-containing sensor histidine kinase [Bacteroidota bacterium]
MKARRTILMLAALSFALVIGIFIWQLSALPNLRAQIRIGLEAGLRNIAMDAATGLDAYFTEQVIQGPRRLEERISPDQFTAENRDHFRESFLQTAATQPLSNAWIAVFPDTSGTDFSAYEYKKPNRYRKSTTMTGAWRSNTDLSNFVLEQLKAQFAPYKTVDSFAAGFWANALDSNLVYVYDRAFNSASLIGTPRFHPKTGQLLGLVFTQTDSWYLEEVLIRNYFEQYFWQGGGTREGLEKRHLQWAVMAGKGSKIILNSVAYGARSFEHVVNLNDINSWLSDFKIGIRFRDASVDEVAASIYNRNLYLIIGMFLLLMILLVLLFRAAVRLLKLSRLKTEFVANVSHEIKTPLASIRLATDTLKLGRARSPEQAEQIVDIISRETSRLQYLIHTLLDFSQMESGQKKYQKTDVQLAEWWESVKAYFGEKAGEGLEVEGDAVKSEGILHVDERALEQVFTILIDNARKYGGGDPRLILRGKQGKGQLRIEVQDFGIGIAKDQQKLIFEKFVRLGNVDQHDVKGHGIGLSIAQAIVQAHGGKIGVKSKVGEGSTFFIELPLQKTAEA